MKNFETNVESGDDRRFIPAPPPAPAPAGRPPRPPARPNRRPLLRLLAVVVLALLAGAVTWLITDHSGKSSKSSKATTKVVSEQGLQTLIASIGRPVYWVGPEPGARYSVEQRSNGQVYVRYLTAQMKADTVATFVHPALAFGQRPVGRGQQPGVSRDAREVLAAMTADTTDDYWDSYVTIGAKAITMIRSFSASK